MKMDSIVDLEDDEQDQTFLTRSNSWSHSQQRPASFLPNSNRKHSTGRTALPSGALSCIYETDDASSVASITHRNQELSAAAEMRNRSKSVSGGPAGQVKKRRYSYTELIASAILSSPEKRKTLAEIYDWFVLNVPSFKDQRYMHSSLGWKNAVRHNLSVQTCFKRVKRHGMEKPSWWTVDLNEIAKRKLVLRPTLSQMDHDPATESAQFLPPRRNTYSGPNPMSGGSTNESGDQGFATNHGNYRVASTNDLATASSMFPKRSHYTPIRPAMTTTNTSDFTGNQPIYTFGSTGHLPQLANERQSPNEVISDGIFLKPCPIDQNSTRSNILNNNSTVTLVCKELPTSNHIYQQGQLELNYHQTGAGNVVGQCPSTPLTPTSSPASGASYQSWSPSAVNSAYSSPHHTMNNHSSAGSSPNRFHDWPAVGESIPQTQDGIYVPNQKLRVKNAFGNVQDISFNGFLPMRTVVKCDGMTQTDESTNRGSNLGKFAAPWISNDYNSCLNEFESDLPEDLAGLQIEGDLQCDINEILNADMGDASITKSNSWTWNSPLEQAIFGNNLDEHHQSGCAKMDISEL